MSEALQEVDSDSLLRQGLGDLPVPVLSSDFDARIHAALGQSPPWWKLLWATVRPACAAGACSLVVTLALLQGMSGPSAASFRAPFAASADSLAQQENGERATAAERNLEHMDLSHASLIGFLPLRAPVPPPPSAAPDARPEPEHSSLQTVRPAAHPAV